MTVLEKIYHTYQKKPKKIAIITKEKSINYRDFWINICKYAAVISKCSLNQNDVIIFENSQDERFCYTLFAIHLLGCIALPIDKNTPNNKINQIKESVQAKKVILKDEIIPTEEKMIPKEFSSENQICDILLSSGSTGEEKKIEYHYGTVLNMISSFYKAYNLKENLIIMITGPLSHAYSFIKMYLAFNYELPFYIYNSLNIIDFIGILDYVDHLMLCTNPTFLHYVLNLFYDDLKNNIEKFSVIECATAPLNKEDADKLLNIFNKKFYIQYGGTELPSLCCIDISKYNYQSGLVGIPMIGTKVEIVNEKEEVINSSKNNPGRIRCSGKNIAPRYYKGENLSYFYTGDIGYFENDLLYLIDREKNFFNIDGFKFSPIEIENVALSCDGILECICFYKEILTLKIIVTEHFRIKDLKDKLAKNLLFYQIPKKIEIVDHIEKTANGKINRKIYQ